MVERNGHYPEKNPDREPQREITQVQRLHLELIKMTQFNDFDGEQVVAGLLSYPRLWKAAIMGNFGHIGELVALRDMERGINNADTLMVLTDKEHAPMLEEMAWRWSAKEVGWLPENEAAEALGLSSADERKILRCWWD